MSDSSNPTTDPLTGTVIKDASAAQPATPAPAEEKQTTSDRMYVVVRSHLAGCFAGELIEADFDNGSRVVALRQARRLWFWDGANDLSDLAVNGTIKRSDCKFGVPVDVVVTDALEVITATEQARESIELVPYWTAA